MFKILLSISIILGVISIVAFGVFLWSIQQESMPDIEDGEP